MECVTLILSAVSPRWAMQASDRRVSYEAIPADDERNKAVFVAERMTFAYTGRASIGGTDTAEWFQTQIARELGSGAGLEAALAGVAKMMSGYLRTLTDQDRRHAFVGVGWTDESAATSRP